MSTIDIGGANVAVLRDEDSGSTDGTSDGTIRAHMTYYCDWDDWQIVWAALLGLPEPPGLAGESRPPHTHPYYPSLICYQSRIEGQGIATLVDGKITYQKAKLTAEYGVPESGPGGSIITLPPPADIEDVTTGQISIVSGGEYLSEDDRKYKWADADAQTASGGPKKRIARFDPWLTYNFSVSGMTLNVEAWNRMVLAYGYVNSTPWNGARPQHLRFQGLECSALKATVAKPITLTLVFQERLHAPWNHSWYPGGLEAGYDDTNFFELDPHPYPDTDFNDAFDLILRP